MKSKTLILNSNVISRLQTNGNDKPVEVTTAMANNDQTTKISQRLLSEIIAALTNIRGWGSVEIFIQNHKITQITERNIRKTDGLGIIQDEFRS